MRYFVEKIEEDIDFGCEERSADTPVMAVVTLKDENGEVVTEKFLDKRLVEEDIQEGDLVIRDESGDLAKVLEDDWNSQMVIQ